MCHQCGVRTTPSTGWVCDHTYPTACKAVVCPSCHPAGLTATWWCQKHRPLLELPHVGWKVSAVYAHPGRDHVPDTAELRSAFDPATMPTSPQQVAALSIQERSRVRAQGELQRFKAWLLQQRHDQLRRRRNRPVRVLADYIHHQVRALMAHRSPARRVTRASTIKTWLRLLAAAVPALRKAVRHPDLAAQVRGYQALAPGLSQTVERGNADKWKKALATARRTFERTPQSPAAAAVVLMIVLQMLGMRPLAALRACLPQGVRTLVRGASGKPSRWQVDVLIDKHNQVGAMQAPQRRWLPVAPWLTRVMAALPVRVGSGQEIVALAKRRKDLLKEHGIAQTYSARRDAAAAADSDGQDVGDVLAHRPGSKTTPVYVGTTTTAKSLRPLMGRAQALANGR